jgi:hypothetical protein
MSHSIAPKVLQKHGVRQSSAPGEVAGIADFVGALGNDEAATAELEHLWHKRETVELSAIVQRVQNLACAPNLDDVTGPQPALSHLLTPGRRRQLNGVPLGIARSLRSASRHRDEWASVAMLGCKVTTSAWGRRR